MTDWQGKRVLILGAARQGVALARWMVLHGARVTLSDIRSQAELAQAQDSLRELAIHWALGGHPLELLDATDIVCLSGGVPADIPIVQEAVRRGIPLSNDTQVFLEAVPCRTVGITGSAGKTTTTALVGEMAQAAFPKIGAEGIEAALPTPHPTAFVGGNIGDPLLNHVDHMKDTDLAILEISSFQLDQMTLSPNVAAVLNVTPNHLDRHHTMEAYTAAKRRILEFQGRDDTAVLGRDDPGAWGLRTAVKGTLNSFGFSEFDRSNDGTYYDDGLLYLRERSVDIPLLRRDQIQLRGDHNVLNVLAAFAIGHATGLPLDAMLTAAEDFRGVPHRLELVREVKGARWYNDSIATTPERVTAAIRSFDEPLVVLLGGRDKKLPWGDLAALVCQRVDHVVLFGEAAAKIQGALAEAQAAREKPARPYTLEVAPNLHDAVLRAHKVAEGGDVVLLAPGGTSFDEFRDFEERGERFRAWVQGLS
jgi:UDP-N-acetylmuramoylalanine--D-glutamate ligase